MKMLTRNRLALSAILLVFNTFVFAQSLTPATYIDIEIQVRQLTNDGMSQRLFLLKLQNEDSIEDQSDLDIDTLTAITEVFRSNGVTAGSHTAFGTQNAKRIADFLKANPDKQQQLDSIESEFELYSSQIRAALVGN